MNKSIKALNDTLGRQITPDVEWQALWAEIGDRFPQKDRFVPAIIMVVTAWNERLLARLENDVYAKWTEDLLEALSEAQGRSVKVHLQVCSLPIETARAFSFYLENIALRS